MARNMTRNAAASKKITAATPKTQTPSITSLSPQLHTQPPSTTGTKKEAPTECYFNRDFRKAAAAYSPTWWGSTIGASELNFSVRYGKRWILTAITAAVCYLREISRLKSWLTQKISGY